MARESGGRGGMRLWAAVMVVVLVSGAFAGGYYLGLFDKEKDVSSKLTIIDDAGRTVRVPRDPARVISLAPSATELLFALGVGDRVVAKDNNSDYPEAAKLIEYNVSGFGWMDLEAILSLGPDAVFAAGINLPSVSDLESRGLAVVVLEPMNLEEVFDNVLLLGAIFDEEQAAERLVSGLEERRDAVVQKTGAQGVARPKVYLEYDSFGGYYTFGAGSFGNELISLAGGENIASNQTELYPKITDEYVIASDPAVIIYAFNSWITTTSESIEARPGWDNIAAVKNDRISPIDDNVISRPGPRLVDGLEALAELIHPELFG